MVQATVLPVAIVLTVTVSLLLAAPAQALPWPCSVVRWYVKNKTPEQLAELARKSGVVLSRKDRREARACLKDKK